MAGIRGPEGSPQGAEVEENEGWKTVEGRNKRSSARSASERPALKKVFLFFTDKGEENPITLERELTKILGQGIFKRIKVRRLPGSYSIDTTEDGALLLDKVTMINERAVQCSRPVEVNTINGVVENIPLSVSERELKEILIEMGLQTIATQRLKRKEFGELKEIKSMKITLQGKHLPDRVKVGFLSLKVRPFYDNPMQCFICKRFNHTAHTCRWTASCGKCGNKAHQTAECTALKPTCVNCKGDHYASFSQCPSMIKERQIQKIVATEKVTTSRAREMAKTGVTRIKPNTAVTNVRKQKPNTAVENSHPTRQDSHEMVLVPDRNEKDSQEMDVTVNQITSTPVGRPGKLVRRKKLRKRKKSNGLREKVDDLTRSVKMMSEAMNLMSSWVRQILEENPQIVALQPLKESWEKFQQTQRDNLSIVNGTANDGNETVAKNGENQDTEASTPVAGRLRSKASTGNTTQKEKSTKNSAISKLKKFVSSPKQ